MEMASHRKNFGNFIRALRLPFITASILPFIAGSSLGSSDFHLIVFLLGLIAVISAHLAANLINDYADSLSGVDWLDKKAYTYFGGSKLIQEDIFREAFYLVSSIRFYAVSFVAVVIISAILRDVVVIGFYLIVLLLSFFYSHKPIQFCYHRLGEAVVFLLFGPALVMGGHYLQTGIFPDSKSIIVSLPFGLLTTSILFANEIPDYGEDSKAGKKNWVSFLGVRRSYILYGVLVLAAFAGIAVNLSYGYFGLISIISFLSLIPAAIAMIILQRHYASKYKLMTSSKLAIAAHGLASAIIVTDLICKKFL
ncbi:MAG: prenyltransferase [Candidatus Omnitrophica bacterium]|nr:prenyltransferase [Candidatus Omnitrophota bacterium]